MDGISSDHPCLTYSSISMGSLATDNIEVTYECQAANYPFTVEYNYEVKLKNGIIHYPYFVPVEGYSVSVEKADYTIETPLNINLRYKETQNCKVSKKDNTDKILYSMSLDNFKAVEYEPYSPLADELFPIVYVAPSEFCYDSQCGNMSTWKDYGLWLHKLLEGRDNIAPDLTNRLNDLVKEAKDEREKVKLIFEYLQNNTRYVSIQLGIGGLQPFEALEVSKTRFGDCKGLTNLMKAMLKSVNIPSEYCEIRMRGKKTLDKKFSSITQTNHAILLVPLKNDSIWLECTNQIIPFGYVHSGIAGHDALVITEEGGKVCRLPSFSYKENKDCINLVYNLDESGNIEGKITITNYLNYSFGTKDRDAYIKRINSNIKLPQSRIDKISTEECKSAYPSTRIEANFSADNFANKTGSRIFLPLCPLSKESFNIFSMSSRNLDIVFDTGYSNSDTITINIPESYSIESLPPNIEIETRFGNLKTNTKLDKNQIIYTQDIAIFSGRYDKGSYKEIKDFYAQITSAIKRKLVLKQL